MQPAARLAETSHRLATFFSPEMVADADSYSPSAGKPALVVADLKAHGLALEQSAPVPVRVDQLALAHDRAYVDDVLALRRANGFGNTSNAVARSLPFTTGSMLSAARHALSHRVAFAPCSGFHHASFERGHGFCTFNGLAVTALVLLHEGVVERVGILDCDMHYGDGTADILRRRDAAGRVKHSTAGERFGEPSDAAPFFRWLDESIVAMADCDLVLYQAGADPHVDDPLGGFLDSEQLAERDAHVFTRFAALRVPVAWNLAGGYQREPDGSIPKVLAIHRRTAQACVRAYAMAHSAGGGAGRP